MNKSSPKNTDVPAQKGSLTELLPVEQLLDKVALGQWTQAESSTRLSDLIPHFLILFKSLHTRRSYLKDLKDFFDFASSQEIFLDDIRDIQETHVALWRSHISYLAQRSVRRKIHCLSSFFQFAKKRKFISENPVQYIDKPRVKLESATNIFTEEETQLLLAYLKERAESLKLQSQSPMDRTYKSAILNYVVLYTLFSVGVRVNELCQLRRSDLHIYDTHGKIILRAAKGDQHHSVLISLKCALLIKDYIETQRPYIKSEDFIFQRAQKTKQEQALTPRAVYDMVRQSAQAVGITKKVSPHSCRGTLATLLHNRGVPIGQIQDLLNHKDITTTSIYIKKADELKEAAATKIDISSVGKTYRMQHK
jgi:integrase/recombinase XerD